MSFKDKSIRIDDWAGNLLFIGPYDSEEVDKVLNANRCPCEELNDFSSNGCCLQCDDTGYIGDFTVSWVDESDKEECNVYEYINY